MWLSRFPSIAFPFYFESKNIKKIPSNNRADPQPVSE